MSDHVSAITDTELVQAWRTGDRASGERLFDRYYGAVAQELSPTPTQVLAVRQELRLLLSGLRAVPVEYQVALEMFYWEQMTAVEIAEALGLPLGTAKTRLRRGRQLLEAALAELADSKVLLQSTVTGLEQWAAAVRAQVASPRR